MDKSASAEVSAPASAATSRDRSLRRRLSGLLATTLALTLAFGAPLMQLLRLALHSTVYSYIAIVPVIAGYICYIEREKLPRTFHSAPFAAIIPFLLGGLCLWSGLSLPAARQAVVGSDSLALSVLAYLTFCVAALLLFLGRGVLGEVAFPAFFLFFLTPIPEGVLSWLETQLKLGSAEVADFFFALFHVPVLREGVVFQLPGIVIEVAQECSGIRSSLVLFFTGLLVAYLFLRTPWRRALLILSVIPLGLLRNGFRVFVIGSLCSRYGPKMGKSAVHTHGGPLFFALSLVPLAGLLWWLYRGEHQKLTASESRA